jgi:hypothetical protein
MFGSAIYTSFIRYCAIPRDTTLCSWYRVRVPADHLGCQDGGIGDEDKNSVPIVNVIAETMVASLECWSQRVGVSGVQFIYVVSSSHAGRCHFPLSVAVARCADEQRRAK